MFIRIKINWTDHFEHIIVLIYKAQVEVRPYELNRLNLTCEIEFFLCLVCCLGTVVHSYEKEILESRCVGQ